MKDFLETVKKSLEQHGLKMTRPREIIVLELLKQQPHVSAEDLLQAVRQKDPQVGLATVYRTLKLLQDCGLAKAHYFGDSQALFEMELDPQNHHDHLICENCHRIEEFTNLKIEALQERVAREHKFQLKHHRMELYGICQDCE